MIEETIKPKKKTTKVEKQVVELKPEGIVIYADAGVRPTNPGPGGWGIHGYVYSKEVPKKGSGSGYKLTINGYKTKPAGEDKGPTEVTPLKYLDGYGTIHKATNNSAEIQAAINGLDYASKYPNTTCSIITDSKYVVTGASEYLNRWKANNWIKSDGQEVSNKLEWQALDNKVSALLAMNSNVEFKWIKGHNGDLGNELADKHATIGVFQSMNGTIRQEVATSLVDGYWKSDFERSPLLHHPRSYFANVQEGLKPGEYYCGTHGTDDELLGNRMSDGAYAYVLLNEQDDMLESVRVAQSRKTDILGSIFLIRLDQLYSPKTQMEIKKWGDAAFYRKSEKSLDLYLVTRMADKADESPLTRELWPPRLASRAIDSLNYLKSIYLEVTNEEINRFTITDITTNIYEASKQGSYKIKSDLTTGATAIGVQANYSLEEGIVNNCDLSLFLGIDLPDRNSLKRLEKLNPKIQLLSWKESSLSFRYVTLVTCDIGKGIWAGCYTNFKFLKK